MSNKAYFAHETAIVDDGAVIGEDTQIWHFCHVQGGARIGRACVFGQNVLVGPGVHIGEGVRVQNNVSVYAGVTLEDFVFVGPSAVFTNVRMPRCEFPRKDALVPTLVERGASIGANVTIVCGVTIGRYALIGAGAVVTHDVPAHALVLGNPARHAGWACACGLRLRGDPDGDPARDAAGMNPAGPSAAPLPFASCGECGRRYRHAGAAAGLQEL